MRLHTRSQVKAIPIHLPTHTHTPTHAHTIEAPNARVVNVPHSANNGSSPHHHRVARRRAARNTVQLQDSSPPGSSRAQLDVERSRDPGERVASRETPDNPGVAPVHFEQDAIIDHGGLASTTPFDQPDRAGYPLSHTRSFASSPKDTTARRSLAAL